MKLGDSSTVRKLPTDIQMEGPGLSSCARKEGEQREEKNQLSGLKT